MKKIGIRLSPYKQAFGRYGKGKFLKIKEVGFDGVDYNIYDTDVELYRMSDAELTEKIAQERADAEKAGIIISQVHGPWRWPVCDGTAEYRAERLQKMKKAVVITAMLGGKNMVVHPIMPFGTDDLLEGMGDETQRLNLEFFKALVDFAAPYKVTVCIENMPMLNFSMARPETLLKFVKMIDHPYFKICLDVGHTALFPDLSIGDEIRRLGGYIACLHIHDNMGDRDAHLPPSKGIVDWAEFFKALDDVGFDGVYSLETDPSPALADKEFEEESRILYSTFKALIEG